MRGRGWGGDIGPGMVVGVAEVGAAADTVLEVVDRAGVVGWLAPEPVDVLRLRGDVRVLVRYAVDHGVVQLADDRSAVAVWLDPPADGPEVPDLRRLRRTEIDDADYAQRVARLRERLWSLAEVPRPWQLLLVVGVGTACRRAGRGSQLLRHRLEELDEAGVPAFAFDVATRALLGSVGFLRIGGARLPSGDSCSLLRRPAGADS